MGATGTSMDCGDDSKYVAKEVNQPQNNYCIQKEIVNDFVIPTKNEEEKEKHRGR